MSLFNPPSAPDPNAAISQATGIANTQTALNTTAGEQSQAGSMVGQNNPYGSLSYSQTGTGPNGTPLYTANVSLTPQQQQMFNTLQSTQTSAGNQGNQLLTNANYGSTDPTTAIGNMTSGLTSQQLQSQMNYLNPFFTTQSQQLDTQLRNQGLAPGNPAYDNAVRQLDTNQVLVVSNAAAQFEPQAFSQAQTLYTEPATLGENLAQFGAPGSPNTDLVSTPNLNVQPSNLTGAVSAENTANQNQYNAQMQQYSGLMSGLFGIPSSVLGGWAQSGGLSSLLGGSSSGGGLTAAAALA